MGISLKLRRAILREVSEIEAIEAIYRQVKAITAEVHIVRPAFTDAPAWTALAAKIERVIAEQG